ncbi:MAG: hypothetical protein FWD38_03255 [Oscillospiraceae bacterium]|nr:hypothetical protein [Oscillospiraceae bacterium]
MGKSGIGVGSASIVLVFAVLCLTVFSLITFVVAGNEKNLVGAKAETVTGYYRTDTLAELILADIIAAANDGNAADNKTGNIPGIIRETEIHKSFDETRNTETVYFFCDISDTKALFVNISINNDSFDILSWRMYDRNDWESDDSVNVWTGD